jgi:hypothetical protein
MNDPKDVTYIQSLLYMIPKEKGGPETAEEKALVKPDTVVDGTKLADLIRKFQKAHKAEIPIDLHARVTPIGKTLTVLQDEADAAEKVIQQGNAEAWVNMTAWRRESPDQPDDFMTPEKTTELEDPLDLKHLLLRVIARPSDIEFKNSASVGVSAGLASLASTSLDFKQGSESRTFRVISVGGGLGPIPVSVAVSTRNNTSGALAGHVFKGLLRSDPKLNDLLGPCVIYSGSAVAQLFGASFSVYCLGLGVLGMTIAAAGAFSPQVVFPASTAFLFAGGTQYGTGDISFSVQVGKVEQAAAGS